MILETHGETKEAKKNTPSCFQVFSDFRRNLATLIPLRDKSYFPSKLLGDIGETYHPQSMTVEERLTTLERLVRRIKRERTSVKRQREEFLAFSREVSTLPKEPERWWQHHTDFMCWAGQRFLETASVVELQSALTAYRRCLTEGLLDMAEQAMVQEGFGPIPARYAWMALGSDGRGEQMFATDQDNLLVYEATEESQKELRERLPESLLVRLLRFDQGETLADADRIDLTGRYFAVFCKKMEDLLDRVGIQRCKGHIMPSYDKWRGTLSRWERRLIGKVKYGAGELSILDMNILMDCRYVAGDEELSNKFMELLHAYLPKNADILNQIAHSAILMPVALGMFKRLKVKKTGPDKGTLDLKLNGWSPLTILVRVLCVKNRLMGETHTLKRLSLLERHALLDTKVVTGLKEAYYHLMVFRALYQLHRFARGLPSTNAIDPSLLDQEGQELLRKSLHAVELLQDQINRSFFGGAV